jgi:REP element-mobilizing transposase RayT
MKHLDFLKNEPKAYGGTLLRTREGRSRPRPLDTRTTMHLVLRSTKAKGDWSFKTSRNDKRVREIVKKFADKNGVRVLSMANVGNHLHFQIKLTSRHTYRPFIRAVTAAIAMAITGASRWAPLEKQLKGRSSAGRAPSSPAKRFWDYRPFTRIVQSLTALLVLKDYIRINELEGEGYAREHARWVIARENIWRNRTARSAGDPNGRKTQRS